MPGFYALKLGPYNPNDNLLLPPCLGDYLPQNHPSRVVSTIIDRLDISDIEVKTVLEAAEKALSMENASEQQELTSEEMAKRGDRP